jgi:hypothetical protein
VDSDYIPVAQNIQVPKLLSITAGEEAQLENQGTKQNSFLEMGQACIQSLINDCDVLSNSTNTLRYVHQRCCTRNNVRPPNTKMGLRVTRSHLLHVTTFPLNFTRTQTPRDGQLEQNDKSEASVPQLDQSSVFSAAR